MDQSETHSYNRQQQWLAASQQKLKVGSQRKPRPANHIPRKHPDVDDDVAIKNTVSIRIVVRKRIN